MKLQVFILNPLQVLSRAKAISVILHPQVSTPWPCRRCIWATFSFLGHFFPLVNFSTHVPPLLPTLQSPLPKIYPSFVVERTSIRAGAWQKTCIDHQREVCWYTRTCHQRVGRVGWYWSGRYPLIQCILSLRHRVLVRISHSFTHAQRERHARLQVVECLLVWRRGANISPPTHLHELPHTPCT